MAETVSTKYICDFCQKNLKTIQSYQYHTSNMVCQKYVCRRCNKDCKTSRRYKYHIKNDICQAKEIPRIKTSITVKPHGHIRACRRLIPYDRINIGDIMSDTPDFFKQVYSGDDPNIIRNFVQLVLCNYTYPENWSVYINHRNKRYISFYQYNVGSLREGSWYIEPVKQGAKMLTDWAIGALEEVVRNYEDLFTPAQIVRTHRLNAKISLGNSELIDDITNTLFCLLYNHASSIKIKNKKPSTELPLTADQSAI